MAQSILDGTFVPSASVDLDCTTALLFEVGEISIIVAQQLVQGSVDIEVTTDIRILQILFEESHK